VLSLRSPWFSPPLAWLPSPSPHPRLPMRCMIGLQQGMWGRGSHGRCAWRATSIRRRRRRWGMWAVHAWDVRSCTISYDIWLPRYRTLDESMIDIAISCNRYDHYWRWKLTTQQYKVYWWMQNIQPKENWIRFLKKLPFHQLQQQQHISADVCNVSITLAANCTICVTSPRTSGHPDTLRIATASRSRSINICWLVSMYLRPEISIEIITTVTQHKHSSSMQCSRLAAIF